MSKKVDRIYDSFVDEMNEIKNKKGTKELNNYIYDTQDFLFKCMTHNILTKKEYESLYISFKQCLDFYVKGLK